MNSEPDLAKNGGSGKSNILTRNTIPPNPSTARPYYGTGIVNIQYLLRKTRSVCWGDVREKRILDVGCGDGTRSVLLALKGARVVGVDISERAIEVARRRAEAHGFSDRAQFDCRPLEDDVPDCQFDVILGWNILHHLIPELPSFLAHIQNFGSRHTCYLFYEPVSLSRTFRRLRLALPIPVSGTPDERPRSPKSSISSGGVRQCSDIILWILRNRLFSRFLLKGRMYEKSSRRRRKVHEILGRSDQLLYQTLGIASLGSTAVIVARQKD